MAFFCAIKRFLRVETLFSCNTCLLRPMLIKRMRYAGGTPTSAFSLKITNIQSFSGFSMTDLRGWEGNSLMRKMKERRRGGRGDEMAWAGRAVIWALLLASLLLTFFSPRWFGYLLSCNRFTSLKNKKSPQQHLACCRIQLWEKMGHALVFISLDSSSWPLNNLLYLVIALLV